MQQLPVLREALVEKLGCGISGNDDAHSEPREGEAEIVVSTRSTRRCVAFRVRSPYIVNMSGAAVAASGRMAVLSGLEIQRGYNAVQSEA